MNKNYSMFVELFVEVYYVGLFLNNDVSQYYSGRTGTR